MNEQIHAYFILDLDAGQRCYCTEGNVVRTFDNVEYTFTDGLEDIRLPNNIVQPGSSGSSGKGKVQLTVFDDHLTPGSLLANYQRIQNTRIRVYITYGSKYRQLAFDGKIDSVAHNPATRTVEFTGGPVRSNVLVAFPAGTTLEDGRLVRRESKSLSWIDGNGQRLTGGFTYLHDAMEFKTYYGTPTRHGTNVSFYRTDINQTSGNESIGSSVQFDGVYLWFEGSAKDEPVPVVYGIAINTSLKPFAHYRVSVVTNPGGAGQITSYYKIYIYPIASHPIIGDPRPTYSSNLIFTPDFVVPLRWGQGMDNQGIIGHVTGASPVPGCCPGYIDSDKKGGTIAYTSLVVQFKDSEFKEVEDINPEWKDFSPDQVWASFLQGKPDVSGRPLRRLGDVVRDVWSTFGGSVAHTVDWQVSSNASERLNAYNIDFVLNSRQKNQTVDRVFLSRFQSQFPLAFGYPRGKLAWFANDLPPADTPATRHLEYGKELVARASIKETPLSQVVNKITYAYANDGLKSGTAKAGAFDHTNNEVCRASVERWGVSKPQSHDMPDTQDDDTADKIAASLLNQFAGIRIEVSYHVSDPFPASLPHLSVLEITDHEAGFDRARFYFLGYKWLNDLTGLTVQLLSVDMV